MLRDIFKMSLMVLVASSVLVSAQPAHGLQLSQDEFRSPQSLDGRKNAPKLGAPSSTGLGGGLQTTETNSGSKASDDEIIFQALFQELDNMIPGEFEVDSKQREAVKQAVKAFQKQDGVELRRILEEQAEADPDFPPADLLLASLSYAVKDVQSGQILLENAAIKYPDYPGVFSAFARVALNQGRISDALAMFEKCSRKIDSPTLGKTAKEFYVQQVLDGMIDVAMKQERFSEARELLEKLRKRIPENPKVMAVSAELEFLEGNIAESQKFLEELKENLPTALAPESILAAWSQRAGKAEEFEKWIRLASEKYPNDPQVQLEFANWAVNTENFPIASSAIQKAEEANGENLFSRNLKAKIAFAKQAYALAESHYEAIAIAQPNNFDAVNMFALSLIESKDVDKQKKALTIAAQNFQSLPDNIVAQAAFGYIQLKLGNKDQASQILARAARTTDKMAPEIEFFLASLLEASGEPQRAKWLVQGALKHEGLFLYRSAANQLLKKLNEGSEALPTP